MSTIEEQKIHTNVRELSKIILAVIAGAGAWWNIKMDIKDYSAKNETNQKINEIRISTIELRLTQIENELKEAKKQREAELQKELEKKERQNEGLYR